MSKQPTVISTFTSFWPSKVTLAFKEQLLSALGAFIGIALTGLICSFTSRYFHLTPWLIAPLGASAVLLFAVPASPFSAPWAIIGGNTISAISGILCLHLFSDPILAGSLAVGLAILGMIRFRCIHPPGGGTALLCVLSQKSDWAFALYPTAINALILVVSGALFYKTLGRPYPQRSVASSQAPEAIWHRYNRSDLEAVLAGYGQILSTSIEDLENLMNLTEARAFLRAFGEATCGSVMKPSPVTFEFSTELAEGWTALQKESPKVVFVLDRAKRISGIISEADFIHHSQTIGLESLLKPTASTHSDKPEVIGQIMRKEWIAVFDDEPCAEIAARIDFRVNPMIAVINRNHKLVGTLGEAQLIKRLYRA